MKKRLSLLLVVAGLFVAGATMTAKAGEGCSKASAATACTKKDGDKKTAATKSEAKTEKKAEAKKESKGSKS